MARSRLKAPRGQQPPEDLKPHPGPRLSAIDEPAEFIYQVYGKALDWKGRKVGGKNTRLPLWHELAAVERRAWRAAAASLRLMLMGGGQIPVQTPAADNVVMAIREGDGYVYQHVPRELLRDTEAMAGGAIARFLQDLEEKLREMNEEGQPDAD